MKKEYFIGIVPPEEYLERVQQFQNRWMGNVGVEPHITLKAQGDYRLTGSGWMK
ncbi:hypothetical protein ACPJHQ_06580 [Rossellomorea sp. H39__3]